MRSLLLERLAEARKKKAAPTRRPDIVATAVLIVGLVLTYASLGGETASAVARHAAIGTGISLGLSVAIELRRGWERLLRADIVALLALYFLLFFEFFFPQPMFDDLVPYPQALEPGVGVCLWAFGVMSIGRHCVSESIRRWPLVDMKLSPQGVMILFWISFAVGYFHMLLSVNFNPLAMVSYFLEPRFEAPWARPQFGDARALLHEMGATIYLVPPLAGIILGRRKTYSGWSTFMVFLALLLTLFYGFCTGTRNIIASYFITFFVSYVYASWASRWKAILLGVTGVAIMALATVYGVRFREVGLRNYLQGMTTGQEDAERSLFVDYNLFIVSKLVVMFPDTVDYIRWEGPLWFLIRPVPRALWPGKPDGLMVSPEKLLGVAEGTSISSTFIGESYMCAGMFGVTVVALLLGILTRWWTKKAFSTQSDFGVVIYGSGFLAVVMTMRSIYILPVAILPTIAAAVIGHFVARREAVRRPVPWLQTTG